MRLMLKIFKIILICALVFGFFTISYFLNKPKENTHSIVSLPESTILYGKISPITFFENLFIYAVFDAQDQELFDALSKKKNSSSADLQSMSKGIDIQEPVEIIVLDSSGVALPILRFALSDSDKFKNEFKEYYPFVKNNKGYLSLLKKNLTEQLAKTITFDIETPSNDLLFFTELNAQKKYFETSINVLENSIVFESTSEKVQKRRIFDTKNNVTFGFEYNKNNLLFLERMFDNTLDLSGLAHICFLYKGFEILKEENLLGFPKFECLVTFHDKNTDFQKLLFGILDHLNVPVVKSDSTIQVGPKTIHIDQLDSTSYHVYLNEEKSSFSMMDSPSRYISGELSALSRIENLGIFSLFVSLIPGYDLIDKNLKQFNPIINEFSTEKSTSVKTQLTLKDGSSIYQKILSLLKELL